jgi:allantoin racemase
LIIAGQVSKRIGVVTTLSRSIVPLEELVRKYGYAERARVYACDVAVLDIERPWLKCSREDRNRDRARAG